jgi:hypothetical protein
MVLAINYHKGWSQPVPRIVPASFENAASRAHTSQVA